MYFTCFVTRTESLPVSTCYTQSREILEQLINFPVLYSLTEVFKYLLTLSNVTDFFKAGSQKRRPFNCTFTKDKESQHGYFT